MHPGQPSKGPVVDCGEVVETQIQVCQVRHPAKGIGLDALNGVFPEVQTEASITDHAEVEHGPIDSPHSITTQVQTIETLQRRTPPVQSAPEMTPSIPGTSMT